MAAREQDNADKVTVIKVPEAVGVFDTFERLQAAFYDLRSVGFHHSDISLLGEQDTLEEKLGSAYWRAPELEDGPRAPRAHFVSEEAMEELEGAIAGGFFFVGSNIAMAAMLTPLSTLAASITAIAIGGGAVGGDRDTSCQPRRQETPGILRKSNPAWWHSHVGAHLRRRARGTGGQDHERAFRTRRACAPLE